MSLLGKKKKKREQDTSSNLELYIHYTKLMLLFSPSISTHFSPKWTEREEMNPQKKSSIEQVEQIVENPQNTFCFISHCQNSFLEISKMSWFEL